MAVETSWFARQKLGIPIGLVAVLALLACESTKAAGSKLDASPDMTSAGGSSLGTGGKAGAPGSGGAGGTKDAGPTRDAAPDLLGAPDLAARADLGGGPDASAAPDTPKDQAIDAPAARDAPRDQAVGGLDSATSVDGASEARPDTGPHTYYVATTGSDRADGSLAAPFRTIQRCATLARPGDRCLIRAGTYRETVTPARSGASGGHISFEAYQGECVSVTGADVLKATWQKHQGSIYVADTPLRFIQLFANGKMLNEARWPNADPDDLVHMPLAQAGPATTETTLEGSTLPAGDWTGAYLLTIPGARWTSYTRKIESYDQVKKIASWTAPIREEPVVPELAPRAQDSYYAFGSLLALDSAGEWFLDSATGKLYLWAPGSVDPNTLKIEIKQRDYGFNLGAREYIDIKGLRLFATSVRMTGASHCVVDGVHARYISHLRETNGYQTGRPAGVFAWTPHETGLVVNVSNPGGSKVLVVLQYAVAGGGTPQWWCFQPSKFDAPVSIPWEKFNTKCWDNSGDFYAREPLTYVGLSVPGELADTAFNFCVNGMAPSVDTGDAELESPIWAIRNGKFVATSTWEGNFWSSANPGSTLTLPDLSNVARATSICASGISKGAPDYSGGAAFGFSLAAMATTSTAPALGGEFNEWKNGSVAFAAADALVATGSDGKIRNNVVHDTHYTGAGEGGITAANFALPPLRNEITDNTISRTGHMGIMNYGDPAIRIVRNRVSKGMQLLDDGGLIYSCGTTGTSAEIAYNHLSDIPCIYGTGIYLDDGASGYTVHHNFIHDISWWGISIKKPNRFFNNTILRTALGAASIYKDGNNTWVDLSSSVFSNNLIEQRPGIMFSVLQKQTTDFADYQIIVPITSQWQKVVVPFASLRQAHFGMRTSLDLTNLIGLSWRVDTLGTYQIDLDDVWLEGITPRLLDDYDGGATNQLGGVSFANCGSGSTCARISTSGYTGNAFGLTGTDIKDGFAGIGTSLSVTSGDVADLSDYTGISFRMRGTATLGLSNGTASTTPMQEHNLDCPVDAKGIPTSTCPVDQGGLFTPYTDGFSGTAPDVGAFESGVTPWTAGSTTIEPTDLCPE